MKFAISTLMRASSDGSTTHHLCVVEGVSPAECFGKAMIHAFAAKPGHVIVGMTNECIKEPDSTYEIDTVWGSFTADGRWHPALAISLSPDEQRQQNIANGHLCAGCYRSPKQCVCLKPGEL